MDSTALAEFQQVSKTYPDGMLGRRRLQAVSEVSFQVQPGEVFGLLGPNRAGKTTLIKILLTLCRASKGRTLRLGRPVTDRTTLARVGYVHEDQAFPRYWHAAGLLEYYGALTMMSEPEVRRRVPVLLEQVGLIDRSQEPIARFSKGMVQRLSLAQAMLNDPDLLVLDEPTEGLDLEGRELVRAIVQQRRAAGRSVLLVSHALDVVEQLCDRIGVLNKGRLIFLGDLELLSCDPATGSRLPFPDALRRLYERSPQ
ncbi:MAG TPA: ABC transporter ATP-binding protein [Gemmataceae bacterium]|nr:ABC transporter ATP-binding protein [Gemmataceae bacterium]